MSTPTLPFSPLADRVRLGIAWLDEGHPNWRDEINLAHLDMSDADQCILGQVFYAEAQRWDPYRGGFTYVLESGNFTDAAGSSLTTAWAIRHGFEAEDEPYADLGLAWRKALLEAAAMDDYAQHTTPGNTWIEED